MIEYDYTLTFCPVCKRRLVHLNRFDSLSKKVCLSEQYHPKVKAVVK